MFDSLNLSRRMCILEIEDPLTSIDLQPKGFSEIYIYIYSLSIYSLSEKSPAIVNIMRIVCVTSM